MVNIVNAPDAGTDLDDLILGQVIDELIDAKAGDDIVLADAGDDTVLGGEGEDLLLGEAGDDLLVGNTGDDTMLGGTGDDVMVWNNGDGSDQMNGGDGYDQVRVNGAGTAGDEFVIRAGDDEGSVEFARLNLGPFQLDISEVEALEVNGQGGDDTITGSEGLAGRIALTLDGGDGDDIIIGGDGDDVLLGGSGDDVLVGFRGDDIVLGGIGDDVMVWNNGDGSDQMVGGGGYDQVRVNGADGAGDEFVIRAGAAEGSVEFARLNLGLFQLDISETETLRVNGQGGDDTITGSEGLDGRIKLVVNAGAGDDVVIGGDGKDELRGGTGNDLIVGAEGKDYLIGGAGNDTFIWNNGDGSDVVRGNSGYDTQIVNGADGAGDIFEISRDGKSVTFERTNLGEFELDLRKVEKLEVNGQDGDDVIKVTGDVHKKIALKLDGGDGADLIIGSKGDDEIDGGANDHANDVLSGGAGADSFIFAGEFGVDTILNFELGVDELVFRPQANAETAPGGWSQEGHDVVYDSGHGYAVFEDMALQDFIDYGYVAA